MNNNHTTYEALPESIKKEIKILAEKAACCAYLCNVDDIDFPDDPIDMLNRGLTGENEKTIEIWEPLENYDPKNLSDLIDDQTYTNMNLIKEALDLAAKAAKPNKTYLLLQTSNMDNDYDNITNCYETKEKTLKKLNKLFHETHEKYRKDITVQEKIQSTKDYLKSLKKDNNPKFEIWTNIGFIEAEIRETTIE